MEKRKVLVTGANGFIGRRICAELAPYFQVIGVCHQSVPEEVPFVPVKWEACSGAPEVLLALFAPDVVIHLMAQTRSPWCAAHPDEAWKLNVETTSRLAEAAFLRETRFFFASTDQVFSGNKGNYVEQDPCDFTGVYGKTKWHAEQRLLSIYDRSPELLCIFRLALTYGMGAEQHLGPVGAMLAEVRAGKSIDLFEDEYRSPILVNDVGRAFLEGITRNLSGLYHLGGPERIDRFTMGIRLAEKLGLNPDLLHKRSIREYRGLEPRCADCSLDISKFCQTFGWTPKNIQDGIETYLSDLS